MTQSYMIGYRPKNATLLAKVKRAEVSLKTKTVPFGELEGGFLEICAPCVAIHNKIKFLILQQRDLGYKGKQ